MENRLKTKIDGKLKLSSIIQTVIDYSIPETEIILDNFSDYSDYDLFLFFTMDSGNGDYNTNRFDVKSGKCLVKTLDLLNAKKLSYFIRNKNVPSVNTTVSIDLTEYRHNAQVFENKDTKKFSQVLYDICEKLEDIDFRVKELEKDKEQEII